MNKQVRRVTERSETHRDWLGLGLRRAPVAGRPGRLDTRNMSSANADSAPETASIGLSVAAVARRLGVAPATLRTWDRRYALGPSEHAAGSHRRYSPEDLARLDVMRRLTRQGVGPAEAARVALGAAMEEPPVDDRVSGGRVIKLPAATSTARGLARAAMALDMHAASELLSETLTTRGVIWTWEEVITPVLIGVGRRWEQTGEGVEVEHLLSEAVAGAFRGVSTGVGPGRNARPVLLASAEEENHSLPLHVLAAALGERQISSRILGPRLPRAALADAIRRSGPAAVFLWSQLPATGDPEQLRELPVQRPATLIVTGGPGWHDALPPGVVQARDLRDAVSRIVEASGA